MNAEYIIRGIKNELAKCDEFHNIQRMFSNVWYYPKLKCFLYEDSPVKPSVIKQMVNDMILIPAGFSKHQGEEMFRYDLNKDL